MCTWGEGVPPTSWGSFCPLLLWLFFFFFLLLFLVVKYSYKMNRLRHRKRPVQCSWVRSHCRANIISIHLQNSSPYRTKTLLSPLIPFLPPSAPGNHHSAVCLCDTGHLPPHAAFFFFWLAYCHLATGPLRFHQVVVSVNISFRKAEYNAIVYPFHFASAFIYRWTHGWLPPWDRCQ